MANSMSPMQASKLATIAFTKNDTQEMPMANSGSLGGGGGGGGRGGSIWSNYRTYSMYSEK